MATRTAWKRTDANYKSCAWWTETQSSASRQQPEFQKTFIVGTTVTADPADDFCDDGRYIYPRGGGIVAFGNTDDAPADEALGWTSLRGPCFFGTSPARVVLLQFDDVTDVLSAREQAPAWVVTYVLSSVFVLLEHSPPPRIFPWF